MEQSIENNLLDKMRSLKGLKEGKNSQRIKKKLNILQDDFRELHALKNSINDEVSLNKYKKKLHNLVDKACEQITAPNVEDFITWIKSLGISDKDTHELKDYLVKNYNDGINTYLERILNHIQFLAIEKSIFTKLMKNAQTDLSDFISSVITDQNGLQSNIDYLLNEITSDLEPLSSLKELAYTDVSQLYSDEQNKRNISWYQDIVKSLLNINQSIKSVDESEREYSLGEVITLRIKGVNNCITILDETDIAMNDDETIKKVFLKYKSKMIEFEGGIEKNLKDFIDKQWRLNEENYQLIRSFLDEQFIFIPKDKWKEFIDGKIVSLIDEYDSIRKSIKFQQIINFEPKGITDFLTKNSGIIRKFNDKCDQIKDRIYNEFSNLLAEYENNNIPMLNRLMANFPNLQPIIAEIESFTEGLENVLTELKSDNNLMAYLEDKFSGDLMFYNKISEQFKKALQESGMGEHLTWLDDKLINNNLNSNDLDNTTIIKALLENGLIKVSIEKTF